MSTSVSTGAAIALPADSVADTAASAADDSVHNAAGVKVAPFGGADAVSITNSGIGGAAWDDFDADYACIGGNVGGGSFGDVCCDDECRRRWS
jgi:hypothetical protein